MASRDLINPLNKSEILSQCAFLKAGETRAKIVGVELAGGAVAPSQKTPSQRGKRQKSYSVRLTPGQNLCKNVSGPKRKLRLQRSNGMNPDRALQCGQITLGQANGSDSCIPGRER